MKVIQIAIFSIFMLSTEGRKILNKEILIKYFLFIAKWNAMKLYDKRDIKGLMNAIQSSEKNTYT